eukprot:538973_1
MSNKTRYDKITASEQKHEAKTSNSCCTPRYNWFMEWRFHILYDFSYSLLEDVLHITIFVLYGIFIGFNWWWYGWIFGANIIIIISIVIIRCEQATCQLNCYVLFSYLIFITLTSLFMTIMIFCFPFSLWNTLNAHASHKREIMKSKNITDLWNICIDDGFMCLCNITHIAEFCCFVSMRSTDRFYSKYYPFNMETIKFIFNNNKIDNIYAIQLNIIAINYYLLSLIKQSKFNKEHRKWIENIADLYHNLNDRNSELLQFKYNTKHNNNIKKNVKCFKIVFILSMVYRIYHLLLLIIVYIYYENKNYSNDKSFDLKGFWFLLFLLCANIAYKIFYVIKLVRDFVITYILLHIVPYKQILNTEISMTERNNMSENSQMIMELFTNAMYEKDLFMEYVNVNAKIASIIMAYSEHLINLPNDGDIEKLNSIFVSAYSQIHFTED